MTTDHGSPGSAASTSGKRRTPPLLVMAAIMLSAWLGYHCFAGFGDQPALPEPANAPAGRADLDRMPADPVPQAAVVDAEAGLQERREVVPAEFADVDIPAVDVHRYLRLQDLPRSLREKATRCLREINIARSRDGLGKLPEGEAMISMERAERMAELRDEIRRRQQAYWSPVAERLEVLLDSGGPGTGVYDPSRDRRSPGASKPHGIIAALEARFGKAVLDDSLTLQSYRKEDDGTIRYAVYAPGMDKLLDGVRTEYRQYYETVVIRQISGLAEHFRFERSR